MEEKQFIEMIQKLHEKSNWSLALFGTVFKEAYEAVIQEDKWKTQKQLNRIVKKNLKKKGILKLIKFEERCRP